MARRKKEEPIVHQNRIAEKAMILFAQKGIDNTKMDEIAAAAGYGKATLYVYFNNKQDIVSFIALKSMEKLKETIKAAVLAGGTTKEIFFSICDSLVRFQEEYPDFFEGTLQYIQIDSSDEDSMLYKIYQLGEDVNQMLCEYLKQGIESGELEETDDYFATIILMWGMISGVIKLAAKKEDYLRIGGNLSKEAFLRKGFEKIYRSISK